MRSLTTLTTFALMATLACSSKSKDKEPAVADEPEETAPRCDSGPVPTASSFSEPVQISTGTRGSTSDQEVHGAVAADGSFTAAFISRRGNTLVPNPIGVSTVAPDGAVNGDRELTGDRAKHYDPWMASDRNDRLYLAWLGFDGLMGPEERMHIGFATSDDGVTWSELRSIHDAEADCPGDKPGCLDKPEMGIGPDVSDPARDAIYVAYAAETGQKVVKSTDGGATFSRSVLASDAIYGEVVVDAKGHVYIIHTTTAPRGPKPFGDPDGEVGYVRSTDGGATFSAPVVVSAPGEPIPGKFANPQIAPDPARGVIYAVYPSGDADTLAWDIQLAVSRDDGATWSRRKINDDPTCANHMMPSAVLDPADGRLHVIWAENRGGAGFIAYAACDPDRCAPNERVSKPFADYDYERHHDTWLGDYNALVFDSKRRVLHAVWAQPVTETAVPGKPGETGEPKPRSRIFHASKSLADSAAPAGDEPAKDEPARPAGAKTNP